jgi:hypothetical protein
MVVQTIKILFFTCVLNVLFVRTIAAQNSLSTSTRLTEKSFLLLWPGQDPADAQLDLNDPIVTDRPDFTEASSTVGKGVTQAEMGYTVFYDKSDRQRSTEQTYPELLLRQGVLRDWLELRIAGSFSTIDSSGFSPTGFNDIYLGTKLGLIPQMGILPEISLVPQITIPSGSASLSSNRALPGMNTLYAWDLSDSTYFGGSTQFNQSVEEDSTRIYGEWAQSLTIGTSLAQDWGCYGEWFAFFPYHSTSAENEHFLNGGVTYLISKDIQWDFRVGTRIDRYAEQSFMGMGISIRFI